MTYRSTLGLLLVSLLWGLTFVAVHSALADISPLLFVGLRFALAAILAVLIFRSAASFGASPGESPAESPSAPKNRSRRAAMRAGVLLGMIQAAAYAAQTIGLTCTTPARSAFVTGLNVALIPFCAWLLTRRRPGWFAGLGLLITMPGLWLLTTPEAGSWARGDTWTLACAVLYALYVVLLTRHAALHDVGGLLISQLAVTAGLCLSASMILEHPHFHFTLRLALALAYTAGLATTLVVWLQIRLQPKVGSTRSALIYATEPVFAALFSWMLIGERLTATAISGGGLILAGMLVSELGAARRPGGG